MTAEEDSRAQTGAAQQPALEYRPVRIPIYNRLRTKLLLLIALSVFITEVMVFMPSIANMRQRWLEDRHQAAEAIALILANENMQPANNKLSDNILEITDALVISVNEKEKSHELAVNHHPDHIDEVIDLTQFSETQAILSSLGTLFSNREKIMRISGPISGQNIILDMTISDRHLRKAMIEFAWYFIFISLTIAIVAATLIYLIVHELLVRPLQNIYENMLDFVKEPDNPSRIMLPEQRRDEVGGIQRRIAAVETELQRNSVRQKHLANLGLAVSKINHDMRNILSSAQLMSDHLSTIKDPMVQKLAPKLIRAIDRAVSYSQSVITYGRTQETPPQKQKLRLRILVAEVWDAIALPGSDQVEFRNFVPENFEIDADSEQLNRVITNLCRNAITAMTTIGQQDDCAVKRVTITAGRIGTTSIIDIEDTGPGMPAKAKEYLFSPFQGSSSHNGSGLGLAICEELIRAHGGTIKLMEDGQLGTHFEIRIPDMPTSLAKWRKNRESKSA